MERAPREQRVQKGRQRQRGGGAGSARPPRPSRRDPPGPPGRGWGRKGRRAGVGPLPWCVPGAGRRRARSRAQALGATWPVILHVCGRQHREGAWSEAGATAAAAPPPPITCLDAWPGPGLGLALSLWAAGGPARPPSACARLRSLLATAAAARPGTARPSTARPGGLRAPLRGVPSAPAPCSALRRPEPGSSRRPPGAPPRGPEGGRRSEPAPLLPPAEEQARAGPARRSCTGSLGRACGAGRRRGGGYSAAAAAPLPRPLPFASPGFRARDPHLGSARGPHGPGRARPPPPPPQ